MEPSDNQNAILDAIQRIPLLSPSANRLLLITADPDYDLDEVLEVIRCDAALTARLLKVVNSAGMGLMQPIASLDRAVSYLGCRLVVSLALSQSTGDLFERPLAGYESGHGDLWRHDLFCAMASRAVARHSRSEVGPDLAFTCGLLHDIGKVVLSAFLLGTPGQAVTAISQGQCASYLQAESQRLGLDHAQVGFELARYWQLPEVLQQAIRHHHHPAAAAEAHRPMVYAVHLGDMLAMMGGQGTGSDSLLYPLDQGYTDFFELSNQDLACILLDVSDEFRKIEAALQQGKGHT
ncbi:MAG: HDOD domain-containing protein [Trichloromonadaceae bacterium]